MSALASGGSGRHAPPMGTLRRTLVFAVVAAIAGFNWYVIRKAARILAEESQRLAELQQHCAALEARASSEQGPAP